MNTITRQDLFSASEVAKDKIIERLVTKYDVQAACDAVKDSVLSAIQTMQLENQALIRQANAQRDQSWRKIAALESRVEELGTEVKKLQRMLEDGLEGGEPVQLSAEPEFSGLSLPVK